MSQKYLLTVNSAQKTMSLQILVPSFTPADAQAFVADFNRKVQSITASEFTFNLDCTEMTVVTPQMVPELEACYKLYKEAGFKKVIFKVKNNVILKMQLGRLARGVGLSQVEFEEVAA